MKKIKKQYLENNNILQVKGSIIGCILSIILVPIGWISDIFLYPEHSYDFLILRLMSSFFTAILLGLHFTQYGRRHIKLLTFCWASFILILLCSMIIISNNFNLVYYNAIILIIFALSILTPLNVLEITIFSISAIAIYIITVSFVPVTDLAVFLNNIYFLIMAAIIGVCATYLQFKLRLRGFCLNYRLNRNIQRLESAQDRLIASEKIDAVSNLSSTLLHEINNPLNYCTTATEAIKRNKFHSKEEVFDAISDIDHGLARIRDIVSDLKVFTSSDKIQNKVSFPIYDAISSAVRISKKRYEDIIINVEIQEDKHVIASQAYIIQLLMSLISVIARIAQNSRSAQEIKIVGENFNNRFVIFITLEFMNKEINDIDINQEIIKVGGVELNMCYEIAKNHGGELKFNNDSNNGTSFYFDLQLDK